MLTRIRAAIGAIVGFGHNVWAQAPAVLQAALIVLAFAVYQFALGYNWTIPATWPELVTMTSTFFLGLWAVAFPIIRDRVWPAFVPWLLSLLRLSMIQETAKVTSAPPGQLFQMRTLWVKAA